MTLRTRNILLAALALAATAAGCGGEPAVLVGRVSPSAAALMQSVSPTAGKTTQAAGSADRLRIRINDEPRDVRLGRDLSFTVQELPTGDVTITIDAGGIEGSVTIKDVGSREMIEISLEAGDGRLSIKIVRRDRTHHDGMHVAPPGPVVISGHHQEVYLDAGRYDSITISGHHIRVVGAARSCNPDDRSTVTGPVTVSGHHVELLDVDVLGRYQVSGHHVRAYATCGYDGHDSGERDDDRDDE